VFILQAELRLTLSYFDTVAYAERAAFFNPKDAGAWLRCAQLYRNTGQLEQAADRYQRVLGIDPSNEEARRELEALGVPPAARPPTTEPASAPAAVPYGAFPSAPATGYTFQMRGCVARCTSLRSSGARP
jgi:tetratricopeptide (TPR) repeat protein